jgi:hypothetical protein
MATVINNPGNDSGSGAGVIVGLVIAVILIAVIFIYGLPALRNGTTNQAPSANIDVNLPGANSENSSY